MKFIDLTGKRFGKLTVIQRTESQNKNAKWLCKCDCGNTKAVFGIDLKSGKTQSCGCIHSKQLADRNYKHGKSQTRLCVIWRSMKERCLNPNCKAYKNYGGRGVKICDEWLNNFQAFYDWAITHGYSEELTIERIDVNGNYCPKNCKWATMKEQGNNKRTNRYITYNGETHTITEWSKLLGFKQGKLLARLNRGWTIEKAINTP